MHEKIDFHKLPPVPKRRKELQTPTLPESNRLMFRNFEQEYQLKKEGEKTE